MQPSMQLSCKGCAPRVDGRRWLPGTTMWTTVVLEVCGEGAREGRGEARSVVAGRTGAEDRGRRGPDQGAAHRVVRHRSAHPELGPLGAEKRAGADGDRARVLR